MRRRSLLWVFLFVFAVGVLTALAAYWNVLMVDLPELSPRVSGMVWGSLGFLFILTTSILFLVRLLAEMRLSQLQRDFLGQVSHELKTPLATLELSTELLMRKTPQTPDTTSLWREHTEELSRLKSQVETLLAAATLESVRRSTIERHPIDLEKWLQAQIPRWKKLLGQDAELRLEGTPLRGQILGNAELLRSSFDNIMDNARQFSRGKLVLALHRENDGVHAWSIRVQDNGWGFPTQEKKKIFHRFYRVKSRSARPAIGGTGLGLWITRAGLRSLGITIEAQSPGIAKGATFLIRGAFTEAPNGR